MLNLQPGFFQEQPQKKQEQEKEQYLPQEEDEEINQDYLDML